MLKYKHHKVNGGKSMTSIGKLGKSGKFGKRALCMIAIVCLLAMAIPASAETSIRFGWWGGDERHINTLAVIAQFQAANPDIKVEAEYGGWDGYQEKLLTQLAGGTAPDVIQVDQPWLADITNQGITFLDLYSVADKINYTDIAQSFLDGYCVLDGKLLGLPTGQNGQSMILNTKVLSDNNIAQPEKWTFDTMLEVGKALHEANPSLYLVCHDMGVIAGQITPIYITQLTGGGYITNDYTLDFTVADLENYFTWVDSMFKVGGLQPQSEASLFDSKMEQNPKWIAGEFAIMMNWASMYSTYYGPQTFKADSMPVPYPYVEGGNNDTISVRPSQVISINGSSKNIDAAAKFVDFLFNDEQAIKTLGTVRSVPAGEKAREILSENDLIEPAIALASDLALPRAAEPVSNVANNTEVGQIITDSIELLSYGMATPAEAAQQCYDNLLDKLAELKDLL
jgi:oligogalacturonide transport system substrate-binding protein